MSEEELNDLIRRIEAKRLAEIKRERRIREALRRKRIKRAHKESAQ